MSSQACGRDDGKPMPMLDLLLELKPFLPARDFDTARRFYCALGFSESWHGADLVEMRLGQTAFLLQDLYRQDWAEHCVMHLLVADVDACWRRIKASALLEHFPGCRAYPPEDQPWGLRQFALVDPSGVLWHIGHRLS